MTIYTSQAVNEKKPEKPQDVVEISFPEELPVKKDYEDDDATETASTAAIVVERPASRRRSHSTLCLLVVSLFVVAAGILGGIYLYRHLMYKKFVGFCPVRPGHPDPSDGRLSQEHVEIDLQYGEYEKIEVPKLDESSPVRVIHDFSLNLSAIVDADHGRCYIMKLDRTHVQPPRNFFDLIQKMMTGQYDVDPVVIRETYRVVRPRITDYSIVGVFITPECYDFNTYRLQKISETVADERALAVDDNMLDGDGVAGKGEGVGHYSDCLLPPQTGLCRASMPMWAFHPQHNDCKQFIYGGCGGNGNKFESRRECLDVCAASTTTSRHAAASKHHGHGGGGGKHHHHGERFRRSTSTDLALVYFDGSNHDITITDF